MEGIYFVNKGDYITSIEQTFSKLGLLTSYGGIDIMLQELGPGKPSWIDPGTDPELMEFFFILEGTLDVILDDDHRVMSPGDSFYVANLKKAVATKTDTGVKFLYITSKPVFNYIYGFTGDINDLRKKCEEKDKYTKNHSNRVMEYSIKICEQMGLSKEVTKALVVSSLFHDIGKIMVPDEILNKPGKLTREEFRHIMRHPGRSRALVEPKFGSDIAEIVEQHHERLDGSGYPFSLSGGEIRLEAKIIAVADSYDAMTTKRPYRDARQPLDAYEELCGETGTLYDRAVVEGLGKYLKEFRLI
jgi:HD-GYP domain-containing protein (c-di-GMP phosphodiesterase class II)